MKMRLTLLVALFGILVVVHCADLDPELKKNTNDDLSSTTTTTTTTNPKISSNEKSSKQGFKLETKKADSSKEVKGQEGVSKDVENANVDKSSPLGDSKAGNVQTDSTDSKFVKGVEKKSKVDEGSGSKDAPKEENLSSMSKESFRGEQCDSSFKCTVGNDENSGMVACLRVPGDESPELSLLIQNKGKGPLDVDIIAPDFIRLEKAKIQIQENNDQKVMVSIGVGKPEKFITLKTHKGNCSLDFMDFLTNNPTKKSNNMSHFTYTNLFRRTPFVILLSLASLLVIASVLMCVTYQRRRFANTGGKYQKLDADLAVSAGPKADSDQKDGWDDNWSDDWGDVEAPTTPSMPLTPSISSAGVSSRKINKDAWKD